MLLALPVKGESFLLRRAGLAVLVDGGWASDKIHDVLKRNVSGLGHLDVVVCTHGDGDHAGGLPNLLNKWAGHVGQLWLPGRWVDVIPQLALDPAEFLGRLVGELDVELKAPTEQVLGAIHNADDDAPRGAPDDTRSAPADHDETSVEHWFDDADEDMGPGEPPPEPDWFGALRRAREDLASDAAAARAFDAARRKVGRRRERATSEVGTRIAHYWLGLIETAKAIRGIAVAAIRHGIRTRWFDFEAFARTRRAVGGAPRFLVPVNAVEQASPPTGVFLYLQLTRINRQSLVFFAPPTPSRLGVVFCGDSPLGDGRHFSHSFLQGRQRPFWPVVATAPHHGSESNRAAYAHLNAWSNVVVLLRAGGDEDQPGSTFLDQHGCIRLCTKCPRAEYPPLLSGVVGLRPRWLLHTIGRLCDCRNPTDGV